MSSIDKCLTPNCPLTAEALEYDSDEDVYLMQCSDDHRHYVSDDTETWK